MRHKWKQAEGSNHAKQCVRCGLYRLPIPNPYAREWIIQWTLPDGTYKTQPTVPIPCKEKDDASLLDMQVLQPDDSKHLVGAEVPGVPAKNG